jgi:hypothetical protein
MFGVGSLTNYVSKVCKTLQVMFFFFFIFLSKFPNLAILFLRKFWTNLFYIVISTKFSLFWSIFFLEPQKKISQNRSFTKCNLLYNSIEYLLSFSPTLVLIICKTNDLILLLNSQEKVETVACNSGFYFQFPDGPRVTSIHSQNST